PMPRILPLLIVLALAVVAAWTWKRVPPPADPPASPPTAPLPAVVEYVTAPASPDGIGKFFPGREIAKVMGHRAIDWLERTEREAGDAPSKAVAAIGLAPHLSLADLGAGSGYYSFRISEKVPQGKVVAVDIQPEMLDFLRKRSAQLGITNVEPHLG